MWLQNGVSIFISNLSVKNTSWVRTKFSLLHGFDLFFSWIFRNEPVLGKSIQLFISREILNSTLLWKREFWWTSVIYIFELNDCGANNKPNDSTKRKPLYLACKNIQLPLTFGWTSTCSIATWHTQIEKEREKERENSENHVLFSHFTLQSYYV